MTTPKYQLHTGKFRAQVLNAPWMVAEMRRRAERGKVLAEQIAPDADPYGEGYIASFKVTARRNGGIHGDRAEAALRNTSPHARYVEFGSEHNDPHHILAGALVVMGE